MYDKSDIHNILYSLLTKCEGFNLNAERFFRHPLGMTISAITATFLWGSAFPVIKLSYQSMEIGPSEIGEQILFAGYRFFLAGIMIFIFYTLLGKKQEMKYKTGSFTTIMKLALLLTFLQYILFYIGLSGASGSQGSIISGTASFFQIIFAHYMLKNDQITVQKVIGLMIGFLGVMVTYIPKGAFVFSVGYGEWFVLASTIVLAFGNIIMKQSLVKWQHVHYLTGYGMIIGSSMLLLLGMLLTDFTFFTFSIKELMMLLYLAFLSASGFLLWNNIMKYNAVGKVSLFNFLIPVFGVILSGMFLDEVVGIAAIAGLMLVTFGIIIVNVPFMKNKNKEEKHQAT